MGQAGTNKHLHRQTDIRTSVVVTDHMLLCLCGNVMKRFQYILQFTKYSLKLSARFSGILTRAFRFFPTLLVY